MNIKILRIFIYVLFFLIFLETAAETRAYFRGYSTILFGRKIPERNLVRDKNSKDTFGPTQEFPFRSPIVPKEKSSDMIRIWIASSSYSEDIYLPVDRIYPTVLGELLNNNGRKFEILNAARAGENIYRNGLKLSELGPLWQPDYVFLYQLSLEMVLISRILYGERMSPLDINESDNTQTSNKLSWAQRIVEELTIYAHLKEYITSGLKRSKILHHSMGDEGDYEFERILKYFIKVCKDQNIKPILSTFATSHLESDLSNLPISVRNWLFLYNDYLSEKGCFDAAERFNRVIIKVANEENCMLIDIGKKMSGKKGYFRDFVHFSGRGHKEIAKILNESFHNLGL